MPQRVYVVVMEKNGRRIGIPIRADSPKEARRQVKAGHPYHKVIRVDTEKHDLR